MHDCYTLGAFCVRQPLKDPVVLLGSSGDPDFAVTFGFFMLVMIRNNVTVVLCSGKESNPLVVLFGCGCCLCKFLSDGCG